MKNFLVISIFSPIALTTLIIAISTVGAPARAADLIVNVTDIHDDRGVVDVTIYQAAGWLDDARAIANLSLPAHPGTVRAVFRDLRPGRYAIATMHDENGDGHMDFNFFGLPIEGYAFSRDARPFFAAPGFDRAAFVLGNGSLTLRIRMVYPLAGVLSGHRH